MIYINCYNINKTVGDCMKFKNIFIILSVLLVALLCMASVAASEDNIYDNNLTSVSSDKKLEIGDESELSISGDKEALSASSTIVVDNVGENHNEMNDHSIRNAIQSASAGDTIMINGDDYKHCHIEINKKLTIKSNVGTKLSSCSSTAFSGHQGMFYLTSGASGTVIEGFNFNNDDGVLYDSEGYAILINGASNIIIRNCTFSNSGYGDAIRLINAKNIQINNVTIDNAIHGINIIDSAKTTITGSYISNNKVSGVSVAGTSKDTKVTYCNVTHNGVGFNLTSSNNVYILSNYIAYNYHGVYVNCNVTKIEIKGNFFNQNTMYEVLNDYRVRNLISSNKKTGYADLEVIDNNYMVGLAGSEAERPVYRITYDYKGSGKGDYTYDSVNDVYKYVGNNKGDYTTNKGAVFLRYVFEINKNVFCPVIFFKYEGGVQWSLSGNYELHLSEITQVKKGIYSISIVDENGNIAKDLSSVPVTFYLNKVGKSVAPQEGDVFRTVMMKNGTATVRFYQNEFGETGNVITAVVPTNGANFDDKVSKTFAVDDAAIPGTPTNTTLTVSNLNTYPNSNQQLIVLLKDINGNPIAGETVTVKLNSKTYSPVSDAEGNVAIKVSISKEGTYTASIIYSGDEVDYEPSSAQAKVVVKKTASKIVSSNLNMIPKMAEYYSITLKDASGNAISSQKVTFKVNGKTYTKTTNRKGVAKVKLKFSQNKKTYKIAVSFKGNNKYKAVSKTNKITVKYSSKTAKLTAPKITIPPKTSKTYTVTLKDGNGKGISKQKVVVKLNGKTYSKKTNSKGQISIKVKFSSLKTYKVSASYGGSKIYKKASSSGKIAVAKTATKITAPSVSILPKDDETYTVTLKANNKALSKQKVTVKVNGKTYSRTTDSKGQASINVNFADEKTYDVNVNYAGNTYYKASKATGKITVAKLGTVIESYNRTFSIDSQKDYRIYLRDGSGNALANQTLSYSFNGANYSKSTDENGQITFDLASSNPSSFEITVNYSGSDKYKESSLKSKITILNETGVIFVDGKLPNSEIQNILDNAPIWSYVEFLGDYYSDISLTVNQGLNIYSRIGSILNAPLNSTALKIAADDVSVSHLIICGNSSDAVDIINAHNVNLINNSIVNHLDESKIGSYADGTVNLPGYGICVSNSSAVLLFANSVSLFESGIFAQHSSDLLIDSNTLSENNYGIKYGFGVANTNITNNEITDQTGLYIMTVPEGPSGYGILLNNSAVNVTINQNHIARNHLGISLDANYSTGIVITQNVITDNILEGIRFNAGYDLAQNAVEPVVTDNAIYRNAVGPSMMILGEMSANPEGIYGPGQYNESLRLKLDSNWYGTNNLVTWDNDTGVVGYGTMCPRISTTAIKFNNLTYNSPANYSIVFYKNGDVASNLPEFEMYAALNRATSKEVEIKFMVVNGVGTFTFNPDNYNDEGNVIEISVGSLLQSTYRTFKITSTYNVPESEIPK